MKLLTRMTSTIGNKRSGFTFIEVMVALVVLSGGIIFIYKTFFLCVDYLSRLTVRMHANELIDAKIADVSRLFHETADITSSSGTSIVTEEINNKKINFTYQVVFDPVMSNDNAFRIKVTLSWSDMGHVMKSSRLALMAL